MVALALFLGRVGIDALHKIMQRPLNSRNQLTLTACSAEGKSVKALGRVEKDRFY